MFAKIGLREPAGTVSCGKHVYLDNGNHYELLQDEASYIVAVDHEDVGLVTFYRITTQDWNDLVDDVHGEVTESNNDSGTIYITE